MQVPALMFKPDLWVSLPPVSEGASVPDDTRLRVDAASLRPFLQKGLLAWFQDESSAEGIGLIGAVALRTFQLLGSTESRRLWWVATGVTSALRHKELEVSPDIKRLIGRLDGELKRLVDAGAECLDTRAPPDLLTNLLYCVAISASNNFPNPAIRTVFGLDDWVLKTQGQAVSLKPHDDEQLDSEPVPRDSGIPEGLLEDLQRSKVLLDRIRDDGALLEKESSSPLPADALSEFRDSTTVFLEETQRIQSLLKMSMLTWGKQVETDSAPEEVRHCFHLLERSSRAVSAHHIAQFAQAMENLLSRVADGTRRRDAHVTNLVERAQVVLPSLAFAFAMPGAEPPDIATFLKDVEKAWVEE